MTLWLAMYAGIKIPIIAYGEYKMVNVSAVIFINTSTAFWLCRDDTLELSYIIYNVKHIVLCSMHSV